MTAVVPLNEKAAFGERGGVPYDALNYSAATLRAELAEVIRTVGFTHADKAADAVMAHYELHKKGIAR